MEGRELPVGWEIVDLGQIATVLSGNGFPKEHQGRTSGDFGFFKVSDISRSIADGQSSLRDARNYISVELAARLKATIIPRGSTVFAKIGEAISLNRRAITEFPCIVDNNVMAVKAVGEIFDKYVFYFLRSQDLRGLSRATAVPSLRKSDISDLQFPVSPLDEQRRIAAKLDTTLAAVEACRQRLDGVAAILKRFRQAVLAAATSGELTREWREERGIDRDWSEVQLGDHAQCFSYGTSAKSQSVGEIPVLRMGNIQAGEIDWQELVYTSDLAEIAKYMLDPGDVLFNRTNSPELVGKTAIYRGDQPAIYAGYLIRVRCSSSLEPEFLNLSLNSPRGRDYCWRVKSDGVSQSNINAKKLAAYPLELPLIEEQQEIIRRAQNLFTLADQLEARLTAARKIVDRLTPALLAKAFCGELVPQDPADEPASVLLERIRAARQAEAGAGKPSRRGRPKAAANPDQLPLDAAPVPPDFLAGLLRECGALSERALLAVSELEPERFEQQLFRELERGTAREVQADGQVLLEAVG